MGHVELAERLEGLPGRPKPSGGRRAQCPAHEDRNPSLSIDTADDGTILLHCLAGCRTEDIVNALGGSMADLFPDALPISDRVFIHLGDVAVARRSAAGGERSFEARYTDGSVAGQHRRKDNGQGAKRIWWDPRGVDTKRLALFRSWDLADTPDPVVITEGERATLAVMAAGVTAVGTYGSSGTPSPEALEVLRDRDVVLWPDHDAPGRSHMAAVAKSLESIARSIRVVHPNAGLPKGWDAADTGPDTVRELVSAATAVGIEPEAVSALRYRSARELMADLPESIEWCWRSFLAFGAITELDGRAKRAGKTTLVTYLIGAIVDGQPFLEQSTMQSPVVFLTEQPPASLRTALERAGLAERDDVSILLWHDSRESLWPAVVASAIAECERIASRVLVIDTLPQFARMRGDAENDAGAALEAMAPVQAAAADHGLAILIVRHERKGGGDVGESGRGSTAFTGSVDVVLQLRRPETPPRPTVRVIQTLSRFDETPDEILIELTDEGYIVLSDNIGSMAFYAIRDLVRQIMTDGHRRTRQEIESELLQRGDKSGSTLRLSAISALENMGELASSGRGVKGDPKVYEASIPAPTIRSDSFAETSERIDSDNSFFRSHSFAEPRERNGNIRSPDPVGGERMELKNESSANSIPEAANELTVVAADDTHVRLCHYYSEHRSQHVRRGSVYVCLLCDDQAAES